MSTETVVVESVNDKRNGWYEVSLADGRVVSTNSAEIAGIAGTVEGTEAEVKLSDPLVRGKFTTIYLNEINGVKGRGGGGGSSPRASSGSPAPRGDDAERQKKISRQWAMGRAVELLLGSGEPYAFPPNAETTANLVATRDWLLSTVED